MSENGWIKIHRSIMDWAFWGNPEAVKLWLWLLLHAQKKPFKHYIKSQKKEVTLEPGQLLASVRYIAEQVEMHRCKVSRMLNVFKNCGNIKTKIVNGMNLVTIINWEEYQLCESGVRKNETVCETILQGKSRSGAALSNKNKNI